VGQPVQPAPLGAGGVVAITSLAHDRRARPWALRLHRGGADAVVADVRIRERDQLPGERGVGHRLLVAGHAGGEHDLSDRVPHRRAHLAVQARAVLQQHVARAGRHHRISFCTALNSGVPARSSSSNRAASTVLTTAPARSMRSSPRAWSSSWRDPTASAGTCTSMPLARRSCTVWLTHTWVSIPHTTACSRPPRSKCSARAAEKTVFSIGCSSSRPTSGAVWPRPLGYCSVITLGSPRMRAPCSSLAQAATTPANDV